MTQEDIILKFRIDELEECLDLIEDEISDKINHGHYKQEESYMNLVLNCTGKSLLTLRELILLCKNGFPDGFPWIMLEVGRSRRSHWNSQKFYWRKFI